MFIYPGIEQERLRNICITEPLRLGQAEILRDIPTGILVWNRPGKLLLLSAQDVESAQALLEGFEKIHFIMLCDANLEPAIAHFHLPHAMRCYQAAYLSENLPEQDPRLDISIPDEQGFARILASYSMDSPTELSRRRDAGELFFARAHDGSNVGFVGMHPEGCFGMIEVFPEQRGKGYGAALEKHILRFCIEHGRIPYCQMEENNHISINLQCKLGLSFCDQPLLMAWDKWD